MKGLVLPVVTAVALLAGAAPAQAQARRCDDGRGVVMTDLGFDPLRGTVRTNVRTGSPELSFGDEPRITGVISAGPAAGRLQEGDVLVAIDGHAITSVEGARRYAGVDPGDEVRLSIRRADRLQDVTVIAGSRCVRLPPDPPAPPAAPEPPPLPAPAGELMPKGRLGFEIACTRCGDERLDGVERFRFQEPPVVTTVERDSAAAAAGLRPGDLLTHVDGVALTAADGWPRWSAIGPGQSVRLTYVRNGQAHQATIPAR